MAALGPRALAAPLSLAAPLVLAACHDIAGPLATVALGLDLAEDDGAAADEGLAIARQGLKALDARLGFLRAAFSRGETPVATETVEHAARGLVEGGATSLLWRAQGAELSAPAARLVLHLASLALTSLPAGGAVTLSAGSGEVSARAEGRGARVGPAAALGLTLAPSPSGGSADWTRGVAAACAAAAMGAAVRVEATSDRVRYVVATTEPIGGAGA